MNFREWFSLKYNRSRNDVKKEFLFYLEHTEKFPVEGTKRDMLLFLDTYCNDRMGDFAPLLCESYDVYIDDIKKDEELDIHDKGIKRVRKIADELREKLRFSELYYRNEELMKHLEDNCLSLAFITDNSKTPPNMIIRGIYDDDIEIVQHGEIKSVRREEGVYFTPNRHFKLGEKSLVLYPHREISVMQGNVSHKWEITGVFPVSCGYCNVDIFIDSKYETSVKGILYEDKPIS